MDVFQCGNSESSHYVFERFVIEPYFGGSKVNLIDPFNYGTNRMRVIDAQTNTIIYSRGYNTLFREWQTTEEATLMERCYEESVSVPLPRNEAYIILEIRNFDGVFEEVFSKLYEPNEMFNTTEQRYVFPVQDVMVNGTPESKVDIVILPEGYTACYRTIEAVIEAHSDHPVSVRAEHLIPESSLRVCPNPATDFVDVFVNQKDGMAEIIDMNGKVVMSVQLKNEVNRIVISNLPNGMYVLRANGESRKFVKQ